MMTLGAAAQALGGTWRLGAAPNDTIWWYDYGNGTWTSDGWYWIDGNHNGVAECYYFDAAGWLLAGRTTPDGYLVDKNGAWIVDGIVQTRGVVPGAVIRVDGGSSSGSAGFMGSSAGFSASSDSVSGKYNSRTSEFMNGAANTGSQTIQQLEPGTQHDYAQKVFHMVNEERAKSGKSSLTWDDDIAMLAEIRVEELVEQYSHTRPDGQSFLSVWDEHGISYKHYGENIAMGQDNPEEVMTTWMNSTSHQNNILDEDYTHMAVGSYYDDGRLYWVQLFAAY